MTNIRQKLIQYIDVKNIHNRTIFDRTGMSFSNIKLMKTNSSYGFTTALLTRFLAAFRDEGIIEYVFSDNPDIARYIFKQPARPDLLSEPDIIQFTAIMQGLWLKDGESYFTLMDIFYILKCLASCTKRTSVYPGIISIEEIQNSRKEYISKIPFLEDDLSAFFQAEANENYSLYSYSEISANYPAVTNDFFEQMLEYGETVTWTDIAAFISKLQNDTNIGVDRLNKIIGLSASTIIRLEIQRTKSYNLDDIIKIDDYFHLEGKMLALCIRATQNSYITSKILDDIDKRFDNSDQIQFKKDKDQRNAQFTKAMTSFIRLSRFIENLNGYTGYFNSFICEYRKLLTLYPDYNSVVKKYLDEYSNFLSVPHEI